MTSEGIYEAWRYVNIVLSIGAFMLTVARANLLWKHLDIQSKFGFLACIFFCVSYLWGTAEAIIKDIPGGPRVLIATVPLFWLVLAGIMPIAKGRMDSLRKLQPGKKPRRRKR